MTNEKGQYLMYFSLIREIMRPTSVSINSSQSCIFPVRSRNEIVFDAAKSNINVSFDTLIINKSQLKNKDDVLNMPVQLREIEIPAISMSSDVKSDKNQQKPNFVRKFVSGAVVGSLILACLTLFALFVVPAVYYQFFSHDPVPVVAATEGSPLGGDFANGAAKTPDRRIPLPEYDDTLPEGNWLIIPRIGVNTTILESVDPDESLKNGVWRVTDFGTPGDESKPMILAAHRFGYKWWWESQYWRYHSFYLLPDLEPGDRVEVISGKRKYIYEIYAGEEGEDIQDYYADLILYTCKYLNSPLRHFRYARLINPNANTQATAQ